MMEDSKPKIITIRCFGKCRFDLYWPKWFEVKAVADARKMFLWLWRYEYFYEENRQAAKIIETDFPEIIEAKKVAWGERSKEFSEGYKDPDPTFFPYNWTKGQRRAESAKRKRENNALFNKVKKAKAEYDKFVKLQETFLEAKNTIYGGNEND